LSNLDITEFTELLKWLPKKPKINKQAAASLTRHIKFIIPETFGKIMKPQSATCQSVIMAALQHCIVEHSWYKEIQRNNYLKNCGGTV
jgi:hypothetical protein